MEGNLKIVIYTKFIVDLSLLYKNIYLKFKIIYF